MAAPYFRSSMASSPIADRNLKRFNFGAFSLTWIWGLKHRRPFLIVVPLLFLLSLVLPAFSSIPDVAVGISSLAAWIAIVVLKVRAGLKGNRWAWESDMFATLKMLRATERIWAIWGLAFLLVEIPALWFGLYFYGSVLSCSCGPLH